MKLFNLWVLSIIFLLGFNACATSENAGANDSAENSSMAPEWYQNVEFTSDTSKYFGFATAIAADSMKAIERAEMQARIHLEKRIAQITEEIRTDLEESGSSDAKNTDFIIILRTAHAGVVEEANVRQSSSYKKDGYYRGFASVEMSKAEIKLTLEKGFNGHPRYWSGFSSSSSFDTYF